MTDDQTPAGPDGAPENDAANAEPSAEQLKAEAAEWRDKALRAVAEAENTKRRAEREQNDARAYAIQRFARDLLAAADNLERALAAAHATDMGQAADPAVKNFVLGIEMTEKDLQQAFERNGLKRLAPAKGEKFDPHLHQAMMEQEGTDAEPGSVVQLLQTGYELFGRVVRPAMVAVAARRPGAQAAPAADPYGKADGAGAGEALDTKA